MFRVCESNWTCQQFPTSCSCWLTCLVQLGAPLAINYPQQEARAERPVSAEPLFKGYFQFSGHCFAAVFLPGNVRMRCRFAKAAAPRGAWCKAEIHCAAAEVVLEAHLGAADVRRGWSSGVYFVSLFFFFFVNGMLQKKKNNPPRALLPIWIWQVQRMNCIFPYHLQAVQSPPPLFMAEIFFKASKEFWFLKR